MMELTVDMIALYDNGIVLIDRKNEPHGLALPGGHVEDGEGLEAAVARELKEETNLDASSMEQFRTYAAPDRDSRYRSVSVLYICDSYGKLKAGSDALDARTISLDDIDNLKDELCFDHYEMLCDYRESVKGEWQVTHTYEKIHFWSGQRYWEENTYGIRAYSENNALDNAIQEHPDLNGKDLSARRR